MDWFSPLFSFLLLLNCGQAPSLAPWPLTCISKGWDFGKTSVHSPFALVTHSLTCASPELWACPGAGDHAGKEFFSYWLIREEKRRRSSTCESRIDVLLIAVIENIIPQRMLLFYKQGDNLQLNYLNHELIAKRNE